MRYSKTRTHFFEMIRFALVGGVSFCVDYGLLYALTAYGGLHYLISSALSFTASVLLNYYLCLSFVFQCAGARTYHAHLLFFGSSIMGLTLNQMLLWSLVELAALHYMLAKLIAAALVMLFNYVMKRRAIRG